MAGPEKPPFPDTLSRVLTTLQRMEARLTVIEARLEAIDVVVTEIADDLLIRIESGEKTDVQPDVLDLFLKAAGRPKT